MSCEEKLSSPGAFLTKMCASCEREGRALQSLATPSSIPECSLLDKPCFPPTETVCAVFVAN